MPSDLDLFLHVNNGVYLTYLDLGRTDLLMRARFTGALRERGWRPVVAAETITIRRSLRAFQRICIRTRIVGWAERAFLIEQRIERDGKTIADAIIDARWIGRGGERLAAAEVMKAAGMDPRSPGLPLHVRDWHRVAQARGSSFDADREDPVA